MYKKFVVPFVFVDYILPGGGEPKGKKPLSFLNKAMGEQVMDY